MFYKSYDPKKPNLSDESQTKKARQIFAKIEHLDPDHNSADRAEYEAQRLIMVRFLEDQANPNGTPYVYGDQGPKKNGKPIPLKPGEEPKGRRTVSGGFNMDSDSARGDWEAAFKDYPHIKPDFDKVRNAQLQMTQVQMDILDKYSIKRRENQLRAANFYGEKVWKYLKPHQRLAIELPNYNTAEVISTDPKTGKKVSQSTVVGQTTNCYKHLVRFAEYMEKGEYKMAMLQLEMARWELQFGSNRDKDVGLQNRRDAEGLLLYPELQSHEVRHPTVVEKEAKALDPSYISPRGKKHAANDNFTPEELEKLIASIDPSIDSFIGAISGPITGMTGPDVFCVDTTNSLISLLNQHCTRGVPCITLTIHQFLIKTMYNKGYYAKHRDQWDQYKKETDKIIQKAWGAIIEPLKWPKKMG